MRSGQWFFPMVLCMAGVWLVAGYWSGQLRGNLPAAFGVTTPQFIFVCSVFLLLYVSSFIVWHLPESHPLSAKRFSTEDSGRYGGAIGITAGIAFSLGELIPNFYIRWSVLYLLLESSALTTVFILNRRRSHPRIGG